MNAKFWKLSQQIKLKLIIMMLFGFQAMVEAKVEVVLGPVSVKNNVNLAAGLPNSDLPEIILSRKQYIISYNKMRRNPNWVAWKLEDKQLGKTARAATFPGDPDLRGYFSKQKDRAFKPVEQSEYVGACFDRGHQIPSADRNADPADNMETFLMSNIVPQTPFLNRVLWEHLEQYTRQMVHNQKKKVYVIAGPIYDQDFGKIGPKADIQVPSKEFKIIVVLEANQTPADITAGTEIIAVVMPNTLEDGSRPPAKGPCPTFIMPQLSIANPVNDWEKYRTTVDEVQKLTGIQFFPTP